MSLHRRSFLRLLLASPLALVACDSGADSTAGSTASPTTTRPPRATATPLPPTPEGRFSTQPARIQRDVIYGRAGGVDLPMDIYRSAGAEAPSPAVVYIHGGSFQVGNNRDIPGPELDELMARGYLLFSVSYRLAPGAPFPAAIEDCKAAVRHIRANAAVYGVDAERIGAWGFSAGGTLASMLGTADESAGFDGSGGSEGVSSRVAAVASYAGISDFTLPLADIRLGNYLQATGAALDEQKRLAAPVTYISADDPPFLFLHGDKDSIVPVAHSQVFHERLQAAGVESEMLVFENAEHTFFPVGGELSPGRDEVARRFGDFFDRTLRRP